jgi:hypothetical protein
MPLASMIWPLAADVAPGATETIFPARTTIEARSITVPLATMIRASSSVTGSNHRWVVPSAHLCST